MSDPDQTDDAVLRAKALERYTGLDAANDPALHEMAALACAVCEVPIALITLQGPTEHRVIARAGIDLEQVPDDEVFCHSAYDDPQLLVIDDTNADERFKAAPHLLGKTDVRFFAGQSINTPDGIPVGTVCAIDTEPHTPSPTQKDALVLIAKQVITHLELKHHEMELQREVDEHRRTEEALRSTERKFREIFEHSTDGIFQSTPDGRFISANRTLATIYGFESADDLIHHFNDIGAQLYVDEARREEFRQQMRDTGLIVGFESQIRRRTGDLRWISENARAVKDWQGNLVHYEGTVEDVTERRQAAIAVRDSEERFRSIWKNSADGMRLTDKEGFIRAVNPALCLIIGMPEEDLVGHPYTVCYQDQGQSEQRLKNYQTNFENRAIPERVEQHFTFRSGRKADLELSNSFVELEGQDPLVLSICHDLTDRKIAEIRLRESELLYHSLVENLPQSIFRKDAEGRFTFVNQSFCKELGKTRGEIIGKTDFDLFPRALADKYYRDDQTLMKNGVPYQAIEAHYVPNQGKIYVEVIKTPLKDTEGKNAGLQGIFWDVTERKRMEEQLAFERDLLRALLDNVPDRIYFKDTESRFLQCSLAMAQRLGLKDPSEVVGRKDADFHPPERAKEYFEDEQRILMTGAPIINKVERQNDTEGNVRWASVTKVPTRNRAGFITGIIGISRDITDLKAAEEELAEARDKALESTRLKSQFLAAMSHEIRTPMNGIIGMTELLLDTPLSAAQGEFSQTINTSAHSLLHIINDILDFSKIEAGKLVIENEPFDLYEVVEDSLELLAHRAQAKNLDPICVMNPGVSRWVKGDSVRLRQILVNLLGNAVKFTESGEIMAHVTPLEETEDSMCVSFAISDTGIGIEPEIQARIFEAFTQADGTTTRRYGGTGLGLSISRQLVEMMGGEMAVTSEPGKGSEFSFTVKFPKAKPAGQTEPPKLNDIRLLVTVENEHRRKSILDITKSWGLLSQGAASGAEAIDFLRQANDAGQPVDLALIDIKLSDTDGLTLAENIHHDTTITELRLVLLTPLGQRMDVEILRLAGFSAALLKPVRQDRLRECLSRVMLSGTESEQDISNDSTIIKLASDRSSIVRTLRILLVEDNTVNQQVALLQLRKLGYTPDLVDNGAKAVDAFRKEQYNLVLMDCQMPIMDGYEATRNIREFEMDNNQQPVPIVAMTADASTDHDDARLEAGMNATITKPVHLPDLRATIESVTSDNAITQPSKRPKAPALEEVPILDPTVLENLREMGEPGEPDPVEELIELFLEDAPMRLEKMVEGIEKQDLDLARVASHSLKGSARNLGALALSDAAESTEDYVKDQQWGTAEAELDRVRHELKRLRCELEKK